MVILKMQSNGIDINLIYKRDGMGIGDFFFEAMLIPSI